MPKGSETRIFDTIESQSVYNEEKFDLEVSLEDTKDSATIKRAREMLEHYGVPAIDVRRFERECVHEVSSIFGRFAMAWVILRAEKKAIENREEKSKKGEPMSVEQQKTLRNRAGLIMIDLDYLKTYNDLFKKVIGEGGGDFYINQVCKIIQSCETTRYLKEDLGLRIHESRWGGDEFAISIAIPAGRQGTLTDYGDKHINVIDIALNGLEENGEKIVKGYEGEIAALDITELMQREVEVKNEDTEDEESKTITLQEFLEQKLKKMLARAKQNGNDPGFDERVFNRYTLPRGASCGYALFGEVSRKNWDPLLNPVSQDEREKHYARYFLHELIAISFNRINARKVERKTQLREAGGVDVWVCPRTAEQQEVEARLLVEQEVKRRVKEEVQKILSQYFPSK